MGKTINTARTEAAKVDVEGYRARVADAVGVAIVELIGHGRDNPNVVMRRMVAAYFLFKRDHIIEAEVAMIMEKSESWVRYSTDYIERRMDRSYAFRTYVEQEMAAYAVASA